MVRQKSAQKELKALKAPCLRAGLVMFFFR
jgi:hypothetical protein